MPHAARRTHDELIKLKFGKGETSNLIQLVIWHTDCPFENVFKWDGREKNAFNVIFIRFE